MSLCLVLFGDVSRLSRLFSTELLGAISALASNIIEKLNATSDVDGKKLPPIPKEIQYDMSPYHSCY